MTSLAEILKALPPDALLSAGQLLAIVEAAKQNFPEPAKEQNYSQWDDQRFIDEKTLADWIGEAVLTVKSWRSKGSGPQYLSNPKNVRYQVGHVRDWLKKRTVANTSEASVKGLRTYFVEGSTAFPVFTYPDGLKLSLEASISHEEEHPEATPKSFRIVNMGNTMEDMAELSECLIKDLPRASELLKNKAQSFDVAYWFYHQAIFGKLTNHQPFIQAIYLLLKNGMDINTANNLSGYSLAHVLGLNQWCFDHPQHYKEFVHSLLEEGLDLDKLDNQSMSALDYAEEDGPLINIHNSMSLAGKLDSMLKK